MSKARLASGVATAQLHHHLGYDPDPSGTPARSRTRVALFRAVNVGGSGKLPMGELRDETWP